MSNALYFNVPLCQKCWDRVYDFEPHKVKTADRCVRCDAPTDPTIYVRATWPPPEDEPLNYVITTWVSTTRPITGDTQRLGRIHDLMQIAVESQGLEYKGSNISEDKDETND